MAKNGQRPESPTDTGYDASLISPNDAADLPDGACRDVYVGVTGNVRITTLGGTDIVFPNVPVGWLGMGAKRVWSTNTTATDLIAAY